jgi:hypothetical protein
MIKYSDFENFSSESHDITVVSVERLTSGTLLYTSLNLNKIGFAPEFNPTSYFAVQMIKVPSV